MIALIEQNRDAVSHLCQQYGVRRLEVIGSAADGTFDPGHSDLDFLVEFDPSVDVGAFHQYFDFLMELQSLFQRRVDLIEPSAVRNPYFLPAVGSSRQVLYDAA